jgi:hypothetical protein
MRNTFRHTLGISCCQLFPPFQSLPRSFQPVHHRSAQSSEEMPSGIKLRDVPVGVELGNSELLANYSSTLANAQRALKRFEAIQQLKIVIETAGDSAV